MCNDKTQFANAILGTSGGEQPADPVEQQKREAKTAAGTMKQRGLRLRGVLGDAYLRETPFATHFDEVCRLYMGTKPGEEGYDHPGLMDRFAQLTREADELEEVARQLEREWNEWTQDLWVRVSALQKKVESSTDDYQTREQFGLEYEEKRDELEQAIDTEQRKPVGLRARPLVTVAFDEAMQLLQRQMKGKEEAVVKTAKSEVSKTGAEMDSYSERSEGEAVDYLIDKFDITSVTRGEAKTTQDYIVKFGSDRRKRIDRQGPAYEETHAKFALQLGHDTVAGVEMQCDFEFDIQFVRKAFRDSIEAGRYIRIYAE